MTQNGTVFLLPHRLTRSAICKYLSNHMHFITDGFKRFSKTNSTDPGQRVPFKSFKSRQFVLNTIMHRARTDMDNI